MMVNELQTPKFPDGTGIWQSQWIVGSSWNQKIFGSDSIQTSLDTRKEEWEQGHADLKSYLWGYRMTTSTYNEGIGRSRDSVPHHPPNSWNDAPLRKEWQSNLNGWESVRLVYIKRVKTTAKVLELCIQKSFHPRAQTAYVIPRASGKFVAFRIPWPCDSRLLSLLQSPGGVATGDTSKFLSQDEASRKTERKIIITCKCKYNTAEISEIYQQQMLIGCIRGNCSQFTRGYQPRSL